MRFNKLKCPFIAIRSSVYIGIFAAFSILYLKDYLAIYLEHNTTFRSKHEEVEKLEYPTLIICVRDGYKPSLMKYFNLSSIYDIYDFDYKAKNLTMNKLFEMLSFNEGIDFEIELNSQIRFKTETILTFGHGKCQKLQPMEELNVYGRVSIDLEWKMEYEEPHKFIVYLVSNDSCHGICDDILPYFKPSKILINPAQPQRIQVPMSTIIYE